MRIPKNYKKINTGFTLVETLITIFIITMIGLLIINFQLDIFSLNQNSSDKLNAQIEVRQTLKTMTAELRSMSPSDNGSYAISAVATSSVTFYVDIDNDNKKEQIRYFQSGTALKKGVTESVNNIYDPADEIITNLISNLANSSSSPIFYYYDKNYDGQSEAMTYPLNIPAIRLIKINILINKNPDKVSENINVTTQVSLRNLKDNL